MYFVQVEKDFNCFKIQDLAKTETSSSDEISNLIIRRIGVITLIMVWLLPVAVISGQSYKQFTLIIYKFRVVIWGIFKSGTTLES